MALRWTMRPPLWGPSVRLAPPPPLCLAPPHFPHSPIPRTLHAYSRPLYIWSLFLSRLLCSVARTQSHHRNDRSHLFFSPPHALILRLVSKFATQCSSFFNHPSSFHSFVTVSEPVAFVRLTHSSFPQPHVLRPSNAT